MNLKDNRFLLAALLVSVLVHLLLFNMDTDMFDTGEGEIYIPVTLVPHDLVREQNRPHEKKQIEPVLQEQGKGGAYLKKGNIGELTARYIEIVLDEIVKRKFSPPESKYYRLIGNVRIGFSIGPFGRFHNIRVVSSSGDNLLDSTAFNAVKNTNGIVKRPAWAGRKTLNITAVIKYQYGL